MSVMSYLGAIGAAQREAMEADERVIAGIAAQAAIAVDNARLFDALDRAKNLAEVDRDAQPAAELFEANPHVQRWLAACQARPAFREMMAEREKEPL